MVACAFLCAAPGARAAPAQKAPDRAREEAKKHADKAKVHYELGEYEQAAEEYILVYRIKQIPELLFNIAQSYKQARLYDKARQFYNAYLRESKNGKAKALVQSQLKDLDALIAQEQREKAAAAEAARAAAAANAAPTPTPTTTTTPTANPTAPSRIPAFAASSAPAVRGPQRNMTLVYALSGGAVALLGGGALFAAKASSIDNELLAHPHSTAAADDLLSSSKTNHMLSGIFLAAGATSALGAGAFYFLPSITGSGVSVQGKF